MGNTIDHNPNPLYSVFCVHSLALVEETKPDFESAFRELSNLLDCLMEKPIDFDRVKPLIQNCGRLFSKINVETQRRYNGFLSRSRELNEIVLKKKKLERDQEIAFILHKKISEIITEFTPGVNHNVKWMTEVSHSLEESLLMITILEDRARNGSWLWKLVPLGWIPASFITQYKLIKLRSERIRIQLFLDKTMKEMETIKTDMKSYYTDKEIIEGEIKRRAVEIEAQISKLREVRVEWNLIQIGVIQFRDMNHLIRILDGQMHLAYFHIYDPCVRQPGKKDLFSRVKYLLEFLSEPEYLLWLKKLVSTKILEELHMKATYLRDLF